MAEKKKEDEESEEKTAPKNHQKEARQKSGQIWPIFLITIGVILLLNNLGILSRDIWLIIWRFWPIMIILFGIEIALGDRLLSKLIVTFLGLAAATVIIAFSLAPTVPAIGRWLRNNLPFIYRQLKIYPERREGGIYTSDKPKPFIQRRIINRYD